MNSTGHDTRDERHEFLDSRQTHQLLQEPCRGHRDEEREATLALLKILVLGNHAIEQGQFRPAEDVFADLGRQAVEEEKDAK
ncbi:hypothetical protein ABL849_25010 [Variovorax sp. 375MFSha3.1]|uniref:hypothetical protein n=1 Tax=unclassified Variovorax TaxID=663243 RepID=UPI003AAA2155